jgi:hypothetical protein
VRARVAAGGEAPSGTERRPFELPFTTVR